ncbi:MAG: hypothetical protein AB9836_04485 [Aminipila sp.]
MSGYNDAMFYEQVYASNNFSGADDLCYKISNYLLDLPRPGYVPKDEGVRAAWIRYLFYDGPNPLSKRLTLPTREEKGSLIYNPKEPNPAIETHSKGYRIFQQSRKIEAQEEQNTQFRIFPGDLYPINEFTANQLINFQIVVGMSQESLVGGMNRSYQLALSTLRALNGVSIGGASAMWFRPRNNGVYTGCKMQPFSDGKFNVGIYLTMGVDIATDIPNGV